MLKHIFLESVFPRFCAVCDREGSFMCEPCLAYWMPVPAPASCAFCGTEGSARTCFSCQDETYLDGLTYYLPYGNVVLRKLLTSWKYHGDRQVEKVIRHLLVTAQSFLEPPVKSWVVSPLPLHTVRARQRGFDQAEILSQMFADLLGVPCVSLLERVHKTAPQARRGHAGRQVGELDGVFRLVEGVQVPPFVLLCDDVFTSGATMDAAARVLKEAGVQMVWGFALAKG